MVVRSNIVSEIVISTDHVIISGSDSNTFFKFSEFDSQSITNGDLMQNSMEVYGINKWHLNNVSTEELEKRLRIAIDNSKKTNPDDIYGCSCTAYTTSCSCSNSKGSCSTSCSNDAYACCTDSSLVKPDCTCKKAPGSDQQ